MLNISDNRVPAHIANRPYRAFDQVLAPELARSLTYWIIGFLAGAILILFLPWTQNIQAKGKLTTLYPNERPQTIHSTLDGRIEAWFVSEGDTVQQGDTIVFLSEIKDAYFDPQLVGRTQEQIEAKKSSIESYVDKAQALAAQIQALRATMELKVESAENKVEQARLKVISDSIDLEAVKIGYNIAETQYARWDTLLKQGIKSRTDWEAKRNKFQEMQAKLVSQRNKVDLARNELLNAIIDRNNVRNEYMEKISKAESERQSAISTRFVAEGDVAKLTNQRTNYEARINFRYITAPITGFINKAITPGIGETVKAGEAVVSILPVYYHLAAEIYVQPVDLPLVRQGAHVRLEFDGWPAIIFSGWPNTSFGTFGGRIYAVENNISPNGRYRVLVEPDPTDEPWPDALRIGSGTNAFALLKDVPIWYELWRQLNGFPPNFYTAQDVKQRGNTQGGQPQGGQTKGGQTKNTGLGGNKGE